MNRPRLLANLAALWMAGCLVAHAAAAPAPDQAETLRNTLPDTVGTGRFGQAP